MPDKSWKQAERRAAALLGSTRAPLSGGNGKQTRSDLLHPSLFVEVKQRRKHSTYTLYRDTRALALKEKKVAVLVLDEVRAPGQLVVIHSDDLPAVVGELIRSNKDVKKIAKSVLTQLD